MCVIKLDLSGNNKSKQNWFSPLQLWSLTSDFDLLHGHHFCHWYGSWKFHDGTRTETLPMGRIVPVRELTGLSGQNRLISSLINHIKLHLPWNEVGRELVPRYTPTKLGRDPRRIALTDHNNLISSLSTHLMTTSPMSEIGWDVVPRYTQPYHVGPRSEKNYTRESANEVWRTNRQTGRHGVLIELLVAVKNTKGHGLYTLSGLKKSR